MAAKISIPELYLCCLPLLSKYAARKKQPAPYFIFYLFSFFSLSFFSFFFFLGKKLTATDAVKDVVHFMGFTIGTLKTIFFFFFPEKLFAKISM